MATKIRSTNFSANAENRISELGLDSALTIALIDSNYVSARTPDSLDSALTIQLIDSNYVQSRETPSDSLLNALIFGG